MARGTWNDFTDKYGFKDGASIEARDWRARDSLVERLNEQPEMAAEGVRAVPYDRPGVHNPCLIILVKDTPGASDEALLKAHWAASDPSPLLPAFKTGLDDFIADAYDEADEAPELKQ